MLSVRGQVPTKRAQIHDLYANIRAVEQRIRARHDAAQSVKLDLKPHTQNGQTLSENSARVRQNEEAAALVASGDAVLEPVGGNGAGGHVNAGAASRSPGMEARVSPSSVKREEFAFMKAPSPTSVNIR